MPREVGAYALLELQGVTAFKTSVSVTVLVTNTLGQPILCMGATKPTDNDVGYAIGCLFIKTDDGVLYSNHGSTTACTFHAVGYA